MMKKFILLFTLLPLLANAQQILPPDSTICFLDSKLAEYQYSARLLRDGKVTGTGEVFSVRNALLRFGERARNGIWTFETIEKPQKDSLKADEYRIHGAVNPIYNGEYAMLFTFNPKDWEKIQHVDTVMVTDGKFCFRGKKNDYYPSILTVGNYPKPTRSIELLLEAGEIKVDLDSNYVSGTPLNELWKQFDSFCTGTVSKIRAIKSNIWKEASFKAYDEMQRNFIRQNLHNGIGRFYLHKFNYYIDDFEQIYAMADDTLKQTPQFAEIFKQHEQELKEEQEKMKKWEKLKGEKYTNHTFEDLSGKKKELKDFVGTSKLLLIDVWASWCVPCRKAIPHVKELYEIYKDKGLEIINVSLDVNETNWKKAVETLQMPWQQVRTTNKEAMNTFQEDYWIESIPHMILLDEKGNILSCGYELTHISLQEVLEKYLENK